MTDSAPFPPDLLALLICPQSKLRVTNAPDDVIASINERIAAGNVVDAGGDAIKSPISAGLLREDGARLYPIIDGIPTLLAPRGIDLDPPVSTGGGSA